MLLLLFCNRFTDLLKNTCLISGRIGLRIQIGLTSKYFLSISPESFYDYIYIAVGIRVMQVFTDRGEVGVFIFLSLQDKAMFLSCSIFAF